MSAVGGINGVFVVVGDDGKVSYVDGQQKRIVSTTMLPGSVTGTVSVAVSNGDRAWQFESCVVVDSVGKIWIGNARGGEFTAVN